MTTIHARLSTDTLRKLGTAGFAFFFIKGVLWLLAPFVFAWFI